MVHKERRATYRVAVLLGTLLLQPEQNVLGQKLARSEKVSCSGLECTVRPPCSHRAMVVTGVQLTLLLGLPTYVPSSVAS